ncbi:MAG: lysophospholipid acyltransferase family protein [Ignavibacteria bacterium]|nr:lysophospholipid acyltransferase family protein [Ignavibacteria bacterium]
MKTLLKYDTSFSSQNEYKTDAPKHSPKLFPSFYFYTHLVGIIFRSNRFAKKGIYNDERWSNSSADVVRSMEKTGVKFHFLGSDNFKKVAGPVIFIGNHMSTLEVMSLPSIIQPNKKVVYVIKQELADYPLFGPVALARDPICVGRENPREDLKIVMEEGSKRIQNGKSIIIFPQKTRTQFFDAASFNSLGVKLAKRNNVPVVPVAVLTDAWGNGKMIKDFGKIDPNKTVNICFGEPFEVKGNGAEEHQRVIDFISGKLIEWGRPELIVKG